MQILRKDEHPELFVTITAATRPMINKFVTIKPGHLHVYSTIISVSVTLDTSAILPGVYKVRKTGDLTMILKPAILTIPEPGLAPPDSPIVVIHYLNDIGTLQDTMLTLTGQDTDIKQFKPLQIRRGQDVTILYQSGIRHAVIIAGTMTFTLLPERELIRTTRKLITGLPVFHLDAITDRAAQVGMSANRLILDMIAEYVTKNVKI